MYIVMLGTAGSGKTSLTGKYSEWLEKQGIKVSKVNLDPGVKVLPYTPDFDIRKYFTIEELMIKYKLGPNGAFMKSSDMIHKYTTKILKHDAFNNSAYNLILIDTPGQMEVFVYRRSGRYFISKLRSLGGVIGVFIIDGENIEDPIDLVIAWTTSILVQLKFDIPVVPIVNKSDKIKNLKPIKLLIENIDEFKKELSKINKGLISDAALYFTDIIKEFNQSLRLVLISAKTGDGMEELHYIVHETFCSCGDLS